MKWILEDLDTVTNNRLNLQNKPTIIGQPWQLIKEE